MNREMFGKRPTPSMVVAILALIVALGGTSYAAINLPKNSVGSKQLKNNSVTGKKVKNNAIRSAKVKDSSLLAKDFKQGQLPLGATGATGPAGPIEGTPAGGDLSGTYPNPSILAGAIGPEQVAQAPAARASNISFQTVPNNTNVIFQLSPGSFNQGNLFSNADDALIVTQPGIYVMTASVGWEVNVTGTRQARILVNGLPSSTEVSNGGAGGIHQSVTLINRFQAGDEIQVGGRQNSGGNLDTAPFAGQGSVNLAGTWLSP